MTTAHNECVEFYTSMDGCHVVRTTSPGHIGIYCAHGGAHHATAALAGDNPYPALARCAARVREKVINRNHLAYPLHLPG